jgi:transmembrane sensor
MHVDWLLIVDYLKNTCSEEDRNRFEEWLRSHPDHQMFFEQLAEVWKATGATYDNFQPDQYRAWEKIAEKLNETKIPIQQPDKKRHLLFRWAAVFLAIVGTGILCFLLFSPAKDISPNSPSVTEIFTTDSCKEVVLPDHSKIWLNKNSRLVYTTSFNVKERPVMLTGEAYFEVKPDTSKPFMVRMPGAIVKVVGTAFNLKTDMTNKEVKLNVVSGVVYFFSVISPHKGVLVCKGERAVFKQVTDTIVKTSRTCANEMAWKTGDFVFSNERLIDVCRMLSDHYNVFLTVADSSLAEFRLSAGYNKQPLKSIIQAIRATLDLNIDSAGRKLVFIH